MANFEAGSATGNTSGLWIVSVSSRAKELTKWGIDRRKTLWRWRDGPGALEEGGKTMTVTIWRSWGGVVSGWCDGGERPSTIRSWPSCAGSSPIEQWMLSTLLLVFVVVEEFAGFLVHLLNLNPLLAIYNPPRAILRRQHIDSWILCSSAP